MCEETSRFEGFLDREKLLRLRKCKGWVLIYILVLGLLTAETFTLIKILEPTELLSDSVLSRDGHVPHELVNFGWVNYQKSVQLAILVWPNSLRCSRDFDRNSDDFKKLQSLSNTSNGVFALLFPEGPDCTPLVSSMLAREVFAECGLLAVEDLNSSKADISNDALLKGNSPVMKSPPSSLPST